MISNLEKFNIDKVLLSVHIPILSIILIMSFIAFLPIQYSMESRIRLHLAGCLFRFLLSRTVPKPFFHNINIFL